MTGPHHPSFEQVVAEGVALQERFPELGLVAVGGTAAALHAHHRYSADVDHITRHLREQFEAVAQRLDAWDGWTTNRVNAPVVILGERHAVELGLRQQRRKTAFEVTKVNGLWIPTVAEALRVKVFLCTERRMTRDFIDIAALSDLLGPSAGPEALSYLNLLYDPVGNQSRLTRFAEVAHQAPVDLQDVELSNYRGLRAPYTDWAAVAATCRTLAAAMLVREAEGDLPVSLVALEMSPHWQPTAQGG